MLYNGVYFPRILTLHRLELPAAGELFVEEEHAVEDEHDGACNTSDDSRDTSLLPVAQKKKAMRGMTLMSLTGESNVRVMTVKAIPPF